VVEELSYDAWGRLRNPSTLAVYAPGSEPELFLGRGYTGHEHLPPFGLINMNARLYDPAVGRFLSPDPFVQFPSFSQSFNRYSYALNNPLKYTDESGEVIFTLICIFVPGMQGFLPIAIAADIAWMSEYASQVANNYLASNSNPGGPYTLDQIWFGKIDWFDVGFAAVGGGVSVAFPVAAPFIKWGSPFITNAVNIYGNGDYQTILGGK
jgi:RHS repeat-associated protein